MRYPAALDKMSWTWVLCALLVCSPALALATAICAEQDEDANADQEEDTSSEQDEETSEDQDEEKAETLVVPLACRRCLSYEANFVGARAFDGSALEGLGFDLGVHRNFGGFSVGGILQYKHFLVRVHDQSERVLEHDESLFELAMEQRILLPAGNWAAFYLGYQLGMLLNFYLIEAVATSGILVSIFDVVVVHAGIGLTFFPFNANAGIDPVLGSLSLGFALGN